MLTYMWYTEPQQTTCLKYTCVIQVAAIEHTPGQRVKYVRMKSTEVQTLGELRIGTAN